MLRDIHKITYWVYVGLGVVLNRSHNRSIACLCIPIAHCLSAKRTDGISTEAISKALKEVSAKREEAIAGGRLHPLDKGGQGIHIRGLGRLTKAGVCL